MDSAAREAAVARLAALRAEEQQLELLLDPPPDPAIEHAIKMQGHEYLAGLFLIVFGICILTILVLFISHDKDFPLVFLLGGIGGIGSIFGCAAASLTYDFYTEYGRFPLLNKQH